MRRKLKFVKMLALKRKGMGELSLDDEVVYIYIDETGKEVILWEPLSDADLGLSEVSDGAPSLDLVLPMSSPGQENAPVTTHFESSIATVETAKEPMGRNKKIAIGLGVASVLGFLVLRD